MQLLAATDDESPADMAFASLAGRPALPSAGNEFRPLSAGTGLHSAGAFSCFTVVQDATIIRRVTIMSFFIRFYSVENKLIDKNRSILFVIA